MWWSTGDVLVMLSRHLSSIEDITTRYDNAAAAYIESLNSAVRDSRFTLAFLLLLCRSFSRVPTSLEISFYLSGSSRLVFRFYLP